MSDKYLAESGLPFYLFDHGYDVWVNGNRGTVYNRQHINDTDGEKMMETSEYWDFDYTDMGTKDMPALIDFVAAATGSDKISQIGYAQGTAMMYHALASAKTEESLK